MNNSNLAKLIDYCQYHLYFLSIWFISLLIIIIATVILHLKNLDIFPQNFFSLTAQVPNNEKHNQTYSFYLPILIFFYLY